MQIQKYVLNCLPGKLCTTFRIFFLGIGVLLTSNQLFAEMTSSNHDALIKKAVLNSEKNFLIENHLSQLEPWQRSLFDQGVLPHFKRFVKDEKEKTPGNFDFIIDMGALKSYLTFRASSVIKSSDAKILILLTPEMNCLDCKKVKNTFLNQIQSQFQLRGFKTELIVLDEIPGLISELLSENLKVEKLLSLTEQKNAQGIFWMNWGEFNEESKNIDSDHETVYSDNKKFWIRSFLQMGQYSIPFKQNDVFEGDSLEKVLLQNLLELWIDFGSKVEILQTEHEILIDISGITEASQYLVIKQRLEKELHHVISIEDRKFSKGRVVFAIQSAQNEAALRKQIQGMSLGNYKVVIK